MPRCPRRKQFRNGNFSIFLLFAIVQVILSVFHCSVSISLDPTAKPDKKLNTSQDSKTIPEEEECAATPLPTIRETHTPERTRLVVFGVAKIQKTRLLATLSGLKVSSEYNQFDCFNWCLVYFPIFPQLEAEITALHSSATWRKKSRPVSLECSHTGQVGRAMIVLLEGVAPNQQ